jgi:hypothetical protein
MTVNNIIHTCQKPIVTTVIQREILPNGWNQCCVVHWILKGLLVLVFKLFQDQKATSSSSLFFIKNKGPPIWVISKALKNSKRIDDLCPILLKIWELTSH